MEDSDSVKTGVSKAVMGGRIFENHFEGVRTSPSPFSLELEEVKEPSIHALVSLAFLHVFSAVRAWLQLTLAMLRDVVNHLSRKASRVRTCKAGGI